MNEQNRQPIGLRGENFLDQKAACDYLACGRTKLFYLRKHRQIAHYRHGGVLYFSREDLDAYLTSCRATLPEK